MAHRRFFVDSLTIQPSGEGAAAAALASVSPAEYHHMVNVVRIHVGEPVELVSRADWTVVVGLISGISEPGDEAIALVDVREVVASTPPFEVDLLFGLSKGETSETVVRMATEIGVSKIVPFFSSRTVVRLDARKAQSRAVRFGAIAEAATKQSHRGTIPSIGVPCELSSVIEVLDQYDVVLVAWEERDGFGIREALSGVQITQCLPGSVFRVAVIIGPEGGLSKSEVDLIVGAGGKAVSLGATILRVDTAVSCALALTFDALAAVTSEA